MNLELTCLHLQEEIPTQVHFKRRCQETRHDASGLSPAALKVFGQFDPLFRCWLCPDDAAEAVNPSPFDVYACLCAGRLFAHLGQRLQSAFGEREQSLHSRLPSASSPSIRQSRRLHTKTPQTSLTPQKMRVSRRLSGKQPSRQRPEPRSAIAFSARALTSSPRVSEGVSSAVACADLDAVRLHLLRHGWLEQATHLERKVLGRAEQALAEAEKVLALAVRSGKTSLAKFLLSTADCRLGWSHGLGTRLFHMALANCVYDGLLLNGSQSLEVLELVLSEADFVNLEAPIWPELPALGSVQATRSTERSEAVSKNAERSDRLLSVTPSSASQDEEGVARKERNHGGPLPVSGAQLPFLKRGYGPLAWVIHAHTSICGNRRWEQEELGARLCTLARVLVKHGAKQDCLPRRQQRTLTELLQGSNQ
eukprot:TRINITY_DN82013_c0_g1_i1.p1 TRINITY_DN82013_c0_g1~~TRINITY_DN82013_c0_g1_i1.p1  ORF type:complete len:423 (+),score=58.76 TRINITY_DN82013_c0_g1_i1:77-1345(+)